MTSTITPDSNSKENTTKRDVSSVTMKCERCGNEWKPRSKNPKKCPRCQNPYRYLSVRKSSAGSVVDEKRATSVPERDVPERSPDSSLADRRAKAEALLSRIL